MVDKGNVLKITFTDEGELVVEYPGGIRDRTGIFASLLEKRAVLEFAQTTAGQTLLIRQRGREIHDPLTSLLRRQPGRELIQQQLIRIAAMPFTGTISIILMDLDHFGVLNKQYGMSVGDEVLRWFARILTRRTRSSDVIVRWGGEEFLVFTSAGLAPDDRDKARDRDTATQSFVQTGATDRSLGPVLNNGEIVAGRFMTSVEAGPCMVGGLAIKQRVTIAVATHMIASAEDRDTLAEGVFETLFEQADALLRKAKTDGHRGRIFSFNKALQQSK
mgnify:CR=1 FL=1